MPGTKAPPRRRSGRRVLLNSMTEIGGAEVREDTLYDRTHLVVPMVMITEGVHEGSEGKVLYLAEELGADPSIWDNKPCVVNHPKDVDGNYVTACTPNVLNTRSVGVPLHTRMVRNKLKSEAWLDKERLRAIDLRVYNRVKRGEKVEVSTGMSADVDWTPGTWDGEPYDGVAHNIRADHLAILPDEVGACSIAKGAGLLANEARQPESTRTVLRRGLAAGGTGLVKVIANELSFTDTSIALCDLLAREYGEKGKYWDGYLLDVYPDRCVFRNKDKTWQVGYSVGKDDGVKISGDPTEVERVTEYRTVRNTLGGADVDKTVIQNRKRKIVRVLIQNEKSDWTSKDKDWLLSLPLSRLKKMVPAADGDQTRIDNKGDGDGKGKGGIAASPPAINIPQEPEVIPRGKVIQLQEYIANHCDPMTKNYLEESFFCHQERQGGLIQKIMANSRGQNGFSREDLMKKSIRDLIPIAELASASAQPSPAPSIQSYFGAQGTYPANGLGIANSQQAREPDPNEEILALPDDLWNDVKKK